MLVWLIPISQLLVNLKGSMEIAVSRGLLKNPFWKFSEGWESIAELEKPIFIMNIDNLVWLVLPSTVCILIMCTSETLMK